MVPLCRRDLAINLNLGSVGGERKSSSNDRVRSLIPKPRVVGLPVAAVVAQAGLLNPTTLAHTTVVSGQFCCLLSCECFSLQVKIFCCEMCFVLGDNF